MKPIIYKDHIIWATSFKNNLGHWIGQAILQPLTGEVTNVQNPLVFDYLSFYTKEDAEDFAINGTEIFIDENPNVSPQ